MFVKVVFVLVIFRYLHTYFGLCVSDKTHVKISSKLNNKCLLCPMVFWYRLPDPTVRPCLQLTREGLRQVLLLEGKRTIVYFEVISFCLCIASNMLVKIPCCLVTNKIGFCLLWSQFLSHLHILVSSEKIKKSITVSMLKAILFREPPSCLLFMVWSCYSCIPCLPAVNHLESNPECDPEFGMRCNHCPTGWITPITIVSNST